MTARNLATKLISDHLTDGELRAGEEIALKMDQTLTQDATGTLVMLELEAMGLERVRTEVSVQYVDHNLIQQDYKNPDDHRFLQSACARFGVWFSRAGNGVSHVCHMERFGKPGKSLIGSDSHTPAGGALGMLAIGAGGLDVAVAMAGEPVHLRMPEIWGVRLTGRLSRGVSAKDVILEMLRRHGVAGGLGRIIEYYGPGLEALSAMDRHVIANMGTELGATTTVFPADAEVRRFLRQQGREDAFRELTADKGCDYDHHEEIDLSTVVPLVARPSSPGDVVEVAEVAGRPIGQAYVGSSANPGFRDLAVVAAMVKGRRVHPRVSLDINPASRQVLVRLAEDGYLADLLRAGARLHQTGCNGCIGMGQAPATDTISLRTVPRNFPGRSGTPEDQVYLVSPETAAASALTGEITDARTLEQPSVEVPCDHAPPTEQILIDPPPDGERPELVMGPNIAELPELEALPERLTGPVLLKTGDDLSTDEILPAGTRVLPFRSNIPRIAEFSFEGVDQRYPERAREVEGGVHFVVGGDNYGQGSSREHAALAPRYLGLRAVVAKSFARIHAQNLPNFGVLPLVFVNPEDYDQLEQGDHLELAGLDALEADGQLELVNTTRQTRIPVRLQASARQVEVLRKGGLINWMAQRL